MTKKEFITIVEGMKNYCETHGLMPEDFYVDDTEGMTDEEMDEYFDNFDRDLNEEFYDFLNKMFDKSKKM